MTKPKWYARYYSGIDLCKAMQKMIQLKIFTYWYYTATATIIVDGVRTQKGRNSESTKIRIRHKTADKEWNTLRRHWAAHLTRHSGKNGEKRGRNKITNSDTIWSNTGHHYRPRVNAVLDGETTVWAFSHWSHLRVRRLLLRRMVKQKMNSESEDFLLDQ